jgi:hypothetical protein
MVPAVPIVVSLCLSLLTLGNHPYWEDSGIFLTAVHDLGVLYPPGFALYEFLCFLWTRLFFFLDYTIAAHLFSAVCAAFAAGVTALAARDLLRSRGRLSRVTQEDPGERADLCGILTGVWMACGFTFWSAALYAKVYALSYLVLALLLWRMIRADDSGKARDFTLVAVLIGLAWQIHPASTLTGLALVLFVAYHARALGWKGVLLRIALAAACAAGPSVLLLPWFSSRDPWLLMGQPTSLGDAFGYLTAQRYFATQGLFGFYARRGASFAVLLWEELLGIGILLVLAGLVVLAIRRRPLLWGILAWVLPYAVGTVVHRTEGNTDCWFAAAWMPLYLALAVGAWQIACWAGTHARAIVAAAGVAGAAWAVPANLSDVSQRGYTLAENYGRVLLDNVDQNAVLLVEGDDAIGLVGYLQRVRGDRPDVTTVTSNYLGPATKGHWYDAVLLRRHPFLRPVPYEGYLDRFPKYKMRQVTTAAFLSVNAECGRPLFCEQFIPLELLRPDYTLVPAGAIWKLVPRSSASALDLRYWNFRVEPEKVAGLNRRARGRRVDFSSAELKVEPEAYEDRYVFLIVMARYHLAMALAEKGQMIQAAQLCGSVLDLGPRIRGVPEIVHLYAITLYGAGEVAKAEPALRRSAEISVIPRSRATACFYLGEIARKRGDEAEATRWFNRSLSTPGLDDATRREIENRLKQRS